MPPSKDKLSLVGASVDDEGVGIRLVKAVRPVMGAIFLWESDNVLAHIAGLDI